MIALAAVCPGAPLLVPGLAPGLARATQHLAQSCRTSVASLVGVDRVLLLTAHQRLLDPGPGRNREPTVHPPGTAVSSAVLTDSRRRGDFAGGLAVGSLGGPPGPRGSGPAQELPGVGVVVGAALLAAAGVDAPTTAIELPGLGKAAGHRADEDSEVRILLRSARTSTDRVGLLVVAEGSGSRGSDSPGGGHPGAAGFDAGLAVALAAGDPTALLAAVACAEASDASMVFTSGTVFAAFAELTRPSPPDRAEVLYDGAPLGVGYLVARWSWDAITSSRS